MFRKHEATYAWRAGWLAVLVHVLLVGILLFSFQWKAAHTVVSVSDVMLWDQLPSKTQTKPKPEPIPEVKKEPPKPEPEVKEEPPVPEPEQIKPEPQPEPEVPKVDIELEKKKAEEAKKKLAEAKKKAEEEKKKKLAEEKKQKEQERQKKLAAIQQATREDTLEAQEKAKDQATLDELKERIDAELGEADRQAAAAASQGIVGEYVAKIQAKVRGHIIKSLCAEGNPELEFQLNLLPNGEFVSAPALRKSSGSKVCDAAVERAIIASEPFPLPKDPAALAQFRNLNLKLYPNGEQ